MAGNESNTSADRKPQTWIAKFACAGHGLAWAIRTQSSFWVHIPIGACVIALAAWLQVESWKWCVLLTLIAMVLAAELVNTAIELIVKVVHPKRDERIGHALDIAAAAVLVTAIVAAIVGLITLGPELIALL